MVGDVSLCSGMLDIGDWCITTWTEGLVSEVRTCNHQKEESYATVKPPDMSEFVAEDHGNTREWD